MIRNLSVLCYAQGFTLWHYKTSDVTGTLQDNPFRQWPDMINPGDIILISSPQGAAQRCVTADYDLVPLV